MGSTRVKLPRGLPFRTEMRPPCTRAGVVGKETGVRAPCVHLFSSCTSPTYVGVCERDTHLDIMCHPSPCLRPVRPPVPTTLHSSSPYLSSFIFSMKLSRYQFFDENSRDIISFYTWDYSCMGQSQQVFCKKMHLYVPGNAQASC